MAAALLVPAAGLKAQTLVSWVGTGGPGTNDYNNASYWSPAGVPTTTSFNCTDDAGSNNVILIQAGDPPFQHGDTLAGNAANTSGAWLQTGSTNFTGGGNWLRMGLLAGSVGYYTLSNGLCQVGGETHISELGEGHLLIAGGTFNTLGTFRVGMNGLGTVLITGGRVNNSGFTSIGQTAPGVGYYQIDNGTNTFTGSQIKIGNGDGGNGSIGYFTMNNGVATNTGELWVGEGTGANRGTGHFIMNGGTFYQVNNWFDIGRWGSDGDLTMNGGTIIKTGSGNNTQWAAYNNNAASSATINMSGGTIDIQGGVVQLAAGGNGTVGTTCTFNQSGGYFHAGSEYQIATDNTMAVATNNVSGNAVLVVDSWLAVGRNSGHGTLNFTNGFIKCTATGAPDLSNGHPHFDIGAGGTGVFNQYGGVVSNVNNVFYMGESGSATWNMNGGSDYLNLMLFNVNPSASSRLNLNGGVIQLAGILVNTNNNPSVICFNGGTLQANSDNSSFISGLQYALLQNGGAVIDSQNYNITVPQQLTDDYVFLSQSGGVTKNGTGSLTLTGANSYSGDTLVNAGTLTTTTASTTPGSVTVADGAAFGIVVQSAGAQYNAANITLGSSSGVSLDFDMGSFGNPMLSQAPLQVTGGGTLTVNGTVMVYIKDALPQLGDFPLIQYQPGGLAGSGNFVLASVPVGVSATIVTNGGNNSIDLVISGVNQPRWDGQAGGTWDTGSDTNWVNIGTGLPTTYTDPSAVVFDDNALGATTVNVAATVSPLNVLVTNNNLNYSFVGTGAISGSTGLNKQGSGALSVLNANAYTGPTVISGGTLTVTNLANGGSSSPVGASSANSTNLVIASATFQYAGAPVAVNRGFEVAGVNSAINTMSNLTLGGLVTASSTPSSGFVKTGPAQLALTTVGKNEFSSGVNPGLQVQVGTLMLDGSGGQTNHVSSDMYVGNTTNNGASLILSNTTLNVDGWFGIGRINGHNNYVSTATLYNSIINAGHLTIGWDGGDTNNLSTQFLTLNGNSVLNDNAEVNLCEGQHSTATVSINDSSILTVKNPTYIASAANSTASVTVANSGQFISTSGWFDIAQGNNSVGSLLVKDNGSVLLSGDFNATDTGVGNATAVVQDNAVLRANNLWVGKQTGASATLLITNNATVVSSNGLTLATYFDGTARVPVKAEATLAGGSLSVNLIQGSTTSGTNNGVFNFNGGQLIIHGPYFGGHDVLYTLQAANVLAGGAKVQVDGTDYVLFSQPLLGGNADGGFTKTGTGTLLLNGASTYTNTTLVSQGILGGAGTLLSPVTVASGATLLGDNGTIGSSLAISNTLTLLAGSSTFMNVTPTSNDQITKLTHVNYGGTLVVSNNSASPLFDGETFFLFNATSAGSGNFSSINILPGGSFTGTFNAGTGVLTIHSAAAPVTINPPVFSGGNLVMTGSGNPGSGYTWLSTTNLAAPVVWVTNSQGTFSAGGTCTNIYMVTNPPVQFFRLRSP